MYGYKHGFVGNYLFLVIVFVNAPLVNRISEPSLEGMLLNFA